MSPPVVLSEDDLAAILSVAAENPCRDGRQQAAMLDAAAHLDSLFVDWVAWVRDTHDWRPCTTCERPVPRLALDPLCGDCREDVTAQERAYEARRP